MRKGLYAVLFCLFLVSGFCGLLYQIVWTRLAFAAFGIITPVLSVVISVFMSGLALGAWAGGRYIAGITRRTRSSAIIFYALVEAVIGVGGLLVPIIFKAGQTLLLPAGDSDSATYLVLSAVILGMSILPWCVCMGATVPAMMAFIKEVNRSDATGFSYLYIANVIGAACGTVSSAGFLIEELGMHRSLLVAACCNFGIAVAALLLNAKCGRIETAEEAPRMPAAPDLALPAASKQASYILFSTGFASMAMEVVWTRAFTPAVSSTIYAYAAILTVYLVATFTGSWLYRRHAARQRVGGVDQLMACLLCLAFLPVILSDPRLAAPHRVRAMVVLSSILPFCGVLGYLTPKLIDESSHGDPRTAGRKYAINIVGCILGPLCAGYVLLPLLGVRWSLVLLVMPFAAYVAYGFRGFWARNARLAMGSSVLAVVLLITSVRFSLSYEDGIIYDKAVVRRDYVATVVSHGQGMDKGLLVNGIGMTFLTPITKCMAHFPLAIRARRPESALVICLGMGTSFRSAASWGIKVTAVELVPSVRDAFGFYFDDAEEVLRKGNARIIVDDGRRFLRRTTERFDVITLDPPPPTTASGSSLLYSEEFYRIAKTRLKDDGILQQWSPGGEKAVVQAMAKSVSKVFPYVRVFRSIRGWGYHFFASVRPLDMPSGAEFEKRLPLKAAADLVEWDAGQTPAQIYQDLLREEVPLAQLVTPDGNVITDDRPFNEYLLVRRFLGMLSGRREFLN